MLDATSPRSCEAQSANMEQQPSLKEQNETFYDKTEAGLRSLFDAARKKHELHFAKALMPEMRGEQEAGWNSAQETQRAFDEYLEFLKTLDPSRMKSRIILGFYCHLAEASGFYEIPKNMLRISEGKPHVSWPFRDLVRKHKQTGNLIQNFQFGTPTPTWYSLSSPECNDFAP